MKVRLRPETTEQGSCPGQVFVARDGRAYVLLPGDHGSRNAMAYFTEHSQTTIAFLDLETNEVRWAARDELHNYRPINGAFVEEGAS